MFVPLHVKSDRSAGLGTASVRELVRGAVERGLPAMALTDVENLYAQVAFHVEARAQGIVPITGVELRRGHGPHAIGETAGRLVLLARDRAGYETLCRVVSRRKRTRSPAGDPVADLVASEPAGVLALSDDDAVLEQLAREGLTGARRLSSDGGSGLAAPELAMVSDADRDLQRLLRSVHEKKRFEDAVGIGSAFSAIDRVRRGRAAAETAAVAELCELDLLAPRSTLPAQTAQAVARLRELARSGLAGRPPRYHTELERELAVLERLGFAPYFLLVAGIVEHARRERIALLARGSAVGSLTAFALGLSEIGPIEAGLSFERFVNEKRTVLPDIDLDVASDRRDELVDFAIAAIGPHRAAPISAHQTFRTRAALREGLKALGVAREAIERLTDRLAPDDAVALATVASGLRERVELALRLTGRFRFAGVHPSGIALADPRLDRVSPIEREPKGVLATQLDARSLDRLGVVKIDLLGNRALAAREHALASLGRIDMPDGDPRTLELLREGRTVGCFQVETPAIRSVLRRMPIRGIADLVAALAIVRPGPASGEAKREFLRRARGEAPPEPIDPRLEALSRETHGMWIYEEQLTAAIAALTGLDLPSADAMRVELAGAEDPAGVERRFLERAPHARDAWRTLSRFACYSFNKAHAISYALLAWQTAYLKAHHPLEHANAILDRYGGAYPLRTVAADLARLVPLLPPHVNASERGTRIDGAAVRIGLGSIKRLTEKNRERMLAARPFRDLAELLALPLSVRELRALVRSGACDGLGPLDPTAYPFPHEDVLRSLARDRSGGGRARIRIRRPSGPRASLYRALVRVKNELDHLDMFVTDHPLRLLRSEAVRVGCVPLSDVAAMDGRYARVVGIVAASRRVATPRGTMQFVTLEDESGLVEAVLAPDVHARLADPVRTPGPYLAGGRVQVEARDVRLLVSNVAPFHERSPPRWR
jgi:DNA polymerase III alpha subunit